MLATWVKTLYTLRLVNFDGLRQHVNREGNQNVKKTIGLISKATTSHVHHTYLYIFVLRDYGVKMHNFAFYGERKQATTKFNFFFPNLDMGPWNSTSGESPLAPRVDLQTPSFVQYSIAYFRWSGRSAHAVLPYWGRLKIDINEGKGGKAEAQS